MNEMLKKYLKTSLTLGLIAGGSALLIGGTNALTAPRIEANTKKKLLSSLSTCFGSSITIEDPENPKDWTKEKPAPQFVNASWKATKDGASVGTLFRARGIDSAGYGYITILVGVYDDKSITNITVLENGNTKPAEFEAYIRSYNRAEPSGKEGALEAVGQTGATFSSTLTMNMVKEAIQLSSGSLSYTEDISKDGLTAFSAKANMYQTMDLSSYQLRHVRKGYIASLDTFQNVVGELFYTDSENNSPTQGMYVGIDKNGTLGDAAIYDANVLPEVSDFVTSFNAASDKEAYLSNLGSSDFDGATGATGADALFGSNDEENTISPITASLRDSVLEALSVTRGTAAQDKRFAAFESGEVNAFDALTANGTYIRELFAAKKGEVKVGYVYHLAGLSERYSTPFEIYFGIYQDGGLGRISIIKNGQTGGADVGMDAFVSSWNKSDKVARLEMVDKVNGAGATYGSALLTSELKEATEDQKGR